jgi:hypothetical protein
MNDKFSLNFLTLLHVQTNNRIQNIIKLEEIHGISSKDFWYFDMGWKL